MHMRRDSSQLLVIDVQEKLAPHIDGGERVVERCGRLIDVARRLGVPVTLTEHYPKGLGPSVAALRAKAGNDTPVFEKIAFSCWRDEPIRARIDGLRRQGRAQVVVAGTEAHVCVGQTALSLLGRSSELEVFLVADAVGSRAALDRDLAVERLRQAGARIVSHEMVAFEWLERGDAPEFKDVLAIVK
jgi:nicotinamidase-related amidase